jgi:hypothetical protein
MIMSARVETRIKERFAKLPSNLTKQMKNASVMLSGTGATGPFIASGVILYVDLQKQNPKQLEVYIVTAKHSLWVRQGLKDPPSDDPSKLASAFQKAMMICYDDNMAFGSTPKQQAAISEIVLVDADAAKGWEYDVMILKSVDPKLLLFAQTNCVYTPPLTPEVKKWLWTRKNYLQRERNSFIQTGFGAIRDEVGKEFLPIDKEGTSTNKYQTLQYRFTEPTSTSTTIVFNNLSNHSGYYKLQQAIQIKADANDSTAPGDSGGPLFLLSSDQEGPNLYLIGVTSGADMATSERECPKPPSLRENCVVTTLEACYAKDIR